MPQAKLTDRIENVLNESRMLLLGGQVMLGFSYRICFEQSFDRIPAAARLAELSGLGIMTAGLGWLLWPAAFHQITEHGRETESIHQFTTRVLDWGLLPFAAGLALSLYPASSVLHMPHAAWIGACAGIFAIALWYGSFLQRGPAPPSESRENPEPEKQSELSSRIKKLLIEYRMALPGAQAFLGFQFSVVFMQAFDNLQRSSQVIHFFSLLATTVSIIFLIAPAAYHRLAERGRDTEHFYRVANRLLLIALVFLAPGMAGDLYVVMRKITGSLQLSSWISGALLLVFYFLWFGVSLWKRRAGPRIV